MQFFNENGKFYLCSKCQTHIVLERDFFEKVYRNALFTGDCIFQNLKNVNYVDLPNEDRVQRVHCRSCDLALGFRYVRVPAAQCCILVQNGTTSKLNLERLSYWNGKEIVNSFAAVLSEPVPGLEPVFQLVPEPPLPAGDIDQVQALVGNNPQPPHPLQGNDDEPTPPKNPRDQDTEEENDNDGGAKLAADALVAIQDEANDRVRTTVEVLAEFRKYKSGDSVADGESRGKLSLENLTWQKRSRSRRNFPGKAGKRRMSNVGGKVADESALGSGAGNKRKRDSVDNGGSRVAQKLCSGGGGMDPTAGLELDANLGNPSWSGGVVYGVKYNFGDGHGNVESSKSSDIKGGVRSKRSQVSGKVTEGVPATEGPYVCQHCGGPYVCKLCGKPFQTGRALGGDDTCCDPAPAPAPREHVCKYCGKAFKTGTALGGHGSKCKSRKEALGGEAKEAAEDGENCKSAPAPKEHACKYCGKVFQTGSALGGHGSKCKSRKEALGGEAKEAAEDGEN